MFEVVNIGSYDRNYKLYEVTNKKSKSNVVEKLTYAVANQDADKFEKYYQVEKEILDEADKYYDIPEFKKKYSQKMKLYAATGTVIGGGTPLLVFAFVKNKYVRAACICASLVGGVVGFFRGFGLAVYKYGMPKHLKQKLDDSFKEYKKLDCRLIKEE